MPRRSSESPPSIEPSNPVTPMGKITLPVVAGLDQVDDYLSSVWGETPNPALSQLVRHILAAGGKKLRPLLTLLAASVHAPADSRAVRVAAAIEILHAATLIHDDVIDHAYVRRGVPTANSVWSNTLAVLSGDYLFAKCSHVLAELGDPELVRMLARTVMRMVASETTQFSEIERMEVLEDEYYAKVQGKTASLFELCCDGGGLGWRGFGGRTRSAAQLRREPGYSLSDRGRHSRHCGYGRGIG